MTKTLKDYLLDGGIKDKEFIHILSTSNEYFTYSIRGIETHEGKTGVRVKYQKIKCKENLLTFLPLSNHLNDLEYNSLGYH